MAVLRLVAMMNQIGMVAFLLLGMAVAPLQQDLKIGWILLEVEFNPYKA
jgi:hypothetical protein